MIVMTLNNVLNFGHYATQQIRDVHPITAKRLRHRPTITVS